MSRGPIIGIDETHENHITYGVTDFDRVQKCARFFLETTHGQAKARQGRKARLLDDEYPPRPDYKAERERWYTILSKEYDARRSAPPQPLRQDDGRAPT
jgi:hypothetical protein